MFVFLFQDRVSVTQAGLKPSAILWAFQVLGLKVLATIASSDTLMFLIILSGGKKAKILGAVDFYCCMWKRQWILKIIDPKCQKVVRAKREGETVESGNKRHWGRNTGQGLPGHKALVMWKPQSPSVLKGPRLRMYSNSSYDSVSLRLPHLSGPPQLGHA